MRPLHLTVEGLRSFRARQAVDFTQRDHIAIVGDTGAGKSSLLEAMVYALYGRSTFSGHAGTSLINDVSEHMRVVLHFTVAGQLWRVTRAVRRRGDRTPGQPSVALDHFGPLPEVPARLAAALDPASDLGPPVESISGARPVLARVEQILGLNYEAFTRTVLLPQGQFSRLLVTDDPSERSKVLAQIWRTDEFTDIGARARDALAPLRVQAARGEVLLDGTPDDPDTYLAALTETAAGTAGDADDTATEHGSAAAALAAVTEAERRTTAASEITATLAGLELLSATAALAAELADAAAELDGRQATIERELAEADTRLTVVPPDHDGLALDEVGHARAQVESLPAALAALRTAQQQSSATTADLERAEAQAATSAGALHAAHTAATHHDAARPPLATGCEVAAARLRLLEDLDRDHASSLTILRTAAKETAVRGAAVAAAATLRDQAADDDAAARKAQDAAEETHAAAQRADAAATAAAHTHAGDACPVCSRDLPATWTPPRSADLDAAARALRSARQQCDTATRALTAGEASLAAATSARDAARQREQEAQNRLDGLHAAIAAKTATGATPHPAPKPGADPRQSRSSDTDTPDAARRLLHQLEDDARDELKAATAQLDAHDARAREMHGAVQRVQAEATHALTDLDSANRRHTDAQQRATDARATVDSSLADLPEHVAALLDLPRATTERDALGARDPDAPVVDTTPALQALADREQVLREREAQRRAARGTIDAARNRLRNLRDDRVRLDIRVRDMATELDHVRDALRAAGAALAGLEPDRRSSSSSASRNRPARVSSDAEPVTGVSTSPATRGDAAVDVPGPAGGLPAASLPTHVTALAAARDALADECSHSMTRAEAGAQSAAAALAERARAAGLSIDTSPDDVVAHLQRRREEAAYTARQTAEQRDAFARVAPAITDLRRMHGEATRLVAALQDLASAMGDAQYPKWLTMRRSHALLAAASRILTEITSGRYAFADVADTDDKWRVIDNDSGLARSPETLSGGEQFLASLALALGMVDMMGRSGGRLESLWLDEGFGALDRGSLDLAVDALASLAAGGRMVVVISHVQAVADQVPHVLAVHRTARGSETHWLTRAERDAAADGDLATHVAGALSGLLA